MRSLCLLLLLLPVVSFSQGLVGKWAEAKCPGIIIEFLADGVVESVETTKQKTTASKSFIKYTTIMEDGISYILYEFHLEGHAEDILKCQYILEGDKLIIFHKRIDYENITTSKEIYKIIEVVYNRVKE